MSIDAKAFAADWERGWNSHDLDRILSHYRDVLAAETLHFDADGLVFQASACHRAVEG